MRGANPRLILTLLPALFLLFIQSQPALAITCDEANIYAVINSGSEYVVNIQDLTMIATVFGLSSSNPLFDPACDVNSDTTINVLDLALVSANMDCTVSCPDGDHDFYGSPAAPSCPNPEQDCNDTDPGINPGADELCELAGFDDNCDGESDFDDQDGMHGDSQCLVSVTGISVSDSSPKENTIIYASCGSSEPGIDSIQAAVGLTDCSFTGWYTSSTANFTCNAGPTGTKDVICYVNTSRSYQTGANQTVTITVFPSECAPYSDPVSCAASPFCKWCDECSFVKWSGSSDRCIGTEDICDHFCKAGECGATCDFDTTGCADTDCDYLDGCYSGTWRDYHDEPNYCQATTCTCSSYPCWNYDNTGTNNDGDSYDTECGDCDDSNPLIYPGAPIPCNYDSLCNVPSDDSACGTIDCDGLNYYFTSGSASATGTNYCMYRDYADFDDTTGNRCEGVNDCKDANSGDCTSYSDSNVVACGTCKYASGACSSCYNYDAGEPCGSGTCDGAGNCVGAVDIHTKLLLHMDGTDGSTTIPDSSPSNHGTATVHGNAQLDTSSKRFGTASLQGSGDTDYIHFGDSDDWYLGGGDWTIDFWLEVDTTKTSGLFQQRQDATHRAACYHYQTEIAFEIWNGGSALILDTTTGSDAFTSNGWHHIAIVRTGTVTTIYVNGNSVTSRMQALPAWQQLAANFEIGRYGTAYALNERIDEFRVSKGIALWTSNFIPPSTALTCAEMEGEECGSAYYCDEEVVEASDTYECCLGNCVPKVDCDVDKDNYQSTDCGGTDCDDNNPLIYPGAPIPCNYDSLCNVPSDDSACGTIDCDGLNYYFTSGSASATGTNYCMYRDYADFDDTTGNRCEGVNDCKDANSGDCTSYSDSNVVACGTCKYALGACSSCYNYDAGEPCGSGTCDGAGNCIGGTPISNCMELQSMKNDLDEVYYLTQDIDCSETSTWNWEDLPDGHYSGFEHVGGRYDPDSGTWSDPFSGILDGKGHKIMNLHIIYGGRTGLFGKTDGAEIRNLRLENAYVGSWGNMVGILIGEAVYTTITDCSTTGSVDSYTPSTQGQNHAGLVGYARYTPITDSYSTAYVEAYELSGGLVGRAYGSDITDSYATGEVRCTGLGEPTPYSGHVFCGGLVGSASNSNIINSYATGDVYSESYSGGLVGGFGSGASIEYSYATGDLNCGGNSFCYAGGLVGQNYGSITDSYATGDVIHGIYYMGGLVGENVGSITNSYSVGYVHTLSPTTAIGGLVGRNNGGTVSDSYWDTQTSGQDTSDGGTGKNTAEMKQQSTFVGWDFTNIWNIAEGVTYPCLNWQESGTCDCGCLNDDGCCGAGCYYSNDNDCEPPKCIQVIDNGNTDDKIDVVFAPDGYMTDGDLEYFESSILPVHIGGSDGILSREPFLSNSIRFNFYYLNMSNDAGCSEDDKWYECMRDYVYYVSRHCPFYDEIVALVNDADWYSGYAITVHASTSYSFAVAPGGPLAGSYEAAEQITSHEFGHSFCGLRDEYSNIFPISQPEYPNSDVYGCPKWCTGTPTQPEPPWQECDTITSEAECNTNPDCTWRTGTEYNRCALDPTNRGYFGDGLSCDPGVECWHNCHGTNGFRSSYTSIMRSVIDDVFNKVSEEHINNIFRCCYPESLSEFTSIDCVAWNTENSDRYSSCTTYGG